MSGHMDYLFQVATLRRAKRDGRITSEVFARRLADVIHDAAGIERPEIALGRGFDEAVALANGGQR